MALVGLTGDVVGADFLASVAAVGVGVARGACVVVAVGAAIVPVRVSLSAARPVRSRGCDRVVVGVAAHSDVRAAGIAGAACAVALHVVGVAGHANAAAARERVADGAVGDAAAVGARGAGLAEQDARWRRRARTRRRRTRGRHVVADAVGFRRVARHELAVQSRSALRKVGIVDRAGALGGAALVARIRERRRRRRRRRRDLAKAERVAIVALEDAQLGVVAAVRASGVDPVDVVRATTTSPRGSLAHAVGAHDGDTVGQVLLARVAALVEQPVVEPVAVLRRALEVRDRISKRANRAVGVGRVVARGSIAGAVPLAVGRLRRRRRRRRRWIGRRRWHGRRKRRVDNLDVALVAARARGRVLALQQKRRARVAPSIVPDLAATAAGVDEDLVALAGRAAQRALVLADVVGRVADAVVGKEGVKVDGLSVVVLTACGVRAGTGLRSGARAAAAEVGRVRGRLERRRWKGRRRRRRRRRRPLLAEEAPVVRSSAVGCHRPAVAAVQGAVTRHGGVAPRLDASQADAVLVAELRLRHEGVGDAARRDIAQARARVLPRGEGRVRGLAVV